MEGVLPARAVWQIASTKATGIKNLLI
jgi:hypothetical protein